MDWAKIILDNLNNILIGLGAGVIIGTLWSINNRLLMIWSALRDIERNTRRRD